MVKTIHSKEKDINKIIELIKEESKGVEVQLIMYFASISYDHEVLSKKFKKSFLSSHVVGCSSHSEMSDKDFKSDSISIMIFDKETIEDSAAVYLKDPSEVDAKMNELASHFNEKPIHLNPSKYVGIVMCDGQFGEEGIFLDKIGNKTDVIFSGGSASDNLTFDNTFISLNGQTYQKGCMLILLKPTNGFKSILTQSFFSCGKELFIDEVDSYGVVVKKINGKSAVEGYAEALNIEIDELKNKYFTNPIGLNTGSEFFVASAKYAKEDGSIVFAAPVVEGVKYELLQVKELVDDTKDVVCSAIDELGGCSGILQFSCVYRTLQLEQEHKMDDYIKIFSDYKMIGFSAYGEQFLTPVNHCASIIVFK